MDREFNIRQFLRSAVATGASDEHIMVGHPPYIRKDGFIKLTNYKVLSKDQASSFHNILQFFLCRQDLPYRFLRNSPYSSRIFHKGNLLHQQVLLEVCASLISVMYVQLQLNDKHTSSFNREAKLLYGYNRRSIKNIK